ncbi:MAG: DUF1800 domain-containing protein [Rhodothermales bacterium]|nr:DUF1800 domain-containing protein [Rhodothermales bacterium]
MGSSRTHFLPSGRLTAHDAPLSLKDARHGLRRAGFGAEPAAAAALIGSSATEFARQMVQEAMVAPLPPGPDWADLPVPGDEVDPAENFNLREQNADRLLAYRTEWIGRMATGGLGERMALIWHNHFVTGADKYFYAAWAHRYLTMLRTHALGNFKDFVYDVGIDPSMLIYLDGRDNLAGDGNENYARELLELFTMGPTGPDGAPNYSERDIREISRALSGWVVSPEALEARFVPERFDDGVKEFFGRKGAFGYGDVIDIIFEERGYEISTFICSYLYESFVSATVDEDAVRTMAVRFLESGFEIAPVVQELIASRSFFDPAVQGVRIKSPVEYGLSLFVDMGITDIENTLLLYRRASLLGQQLFNPPDVNGWPGHFTWINTTTLPYRAQLSETYFSGRGGGVPDLRAMAAALVDADDPHAVFRLPTAIAEHLLPLPAELLDIPAPESDFGGNLEARPIPDWVWDAPPHVVHLSKIFLSGAPWYEWSLDRPEANSRLVGFVTFIATYPEFHLV